MGITGFEGLFDQRVGHLKLRGYRLAVIVDIKSWEMYMFVDLCLVAINNYSMVSVVFCIS